MAAISSIPRRTHAARARYCRKPKSTGVAKMTTNGMRLPGFVACSSPVYVRVGPLQEEVSPQVNGSVPTKIVNKPRRAQGLHGRDLAGVTGEGSLVWISFSIDSLLIGDRAEVRQTAPMSSSPECKQSQCSSHEHTHFRRFGMTYRMTATLAMDNVVRLEPAVTKSLTFVGTSLASNPKGLVPNPQMQASEAETADGITRTHVDRSSVAMRISTSVCEVRCAVSTSLRRVECAARPIERRSRDVLVIGLVLCCPP